MVRGLQRHGASDRPERLDAQGAGTEHHRIKYGGPLWLPAGGYLVLGRNADTATNGGVPVSYRYTGFTLGNSDDEITLLDGAGTEIDRVAYDGGPAFPDLTARRCS